MTTVLAVYNNRGVVGRCDAKCHEATTADCDCICGGANHGCGTTAAIENTHECAGYFMGPVALALFKIRNPEAAATRVEAMPEQLGLDVGEGS
jgi:hypothetical protein